MAYSKAKVNNIGDKSSPCFKPLLIGNIADQSTSTWTVLYAGSDMFLLALPVYGYQIQ
jgi:hypothetical protein